MKLPVEFLENIKQILSAPEYDEFLRSYDEGRFYGIRANTLKISLEKLPEVVEKVVDLGKKVPWCDTGFYYENGQPGRSPLYHAGVYYIQEPSAMYPGGNVPIEKGDYVLDICAAPGGKSTQIAGRLAGTGLLVSNDISEERAKALVKNLQMCGAVNSIVTNETPAKLAGKFPEFFDVVLVDAPCSGEGMFRKDEEAVTSWESFKKERCRSMQDEILEEVDKMLRPGGILSYSTCTFNMHENEETIGAFLENHPEYYLIETPKIGGIADGIGENFAKTARLWPQNLKGEGHFTAFLKKGEGERPNRENKEATGKKAKKEKMSSVKQLECAPIELREFYEFYMTNEPPKGHYFTINENLYYLPVKLPNIDGIKVEMAGVHMGTILHGEFKPSHRFSLINRPEDFAFSIVLKPDSDEVTRYLKGETVSLTGATEGTLLANGETYPIEALLEDTGIKGLCAVAISAGNSDDENFVLGLGQIMNGTIKNLYPKGWRRYS